MTASSKHASFIEGFSSPRCRYFRQLQAINDSVAPIELGDQTIDEALTLCIEEHSAAEKVVNTRQARQRYLNSMFRADEEDDEERSCVLCKCEFEKGVILGCKCAVSQIRLLNLISR
jgi:E3 ubiquitin-protein ligase SHPRH